MNNDKGTIYLIQPAELVGTDRYNIICSTKNDLDTFKKDYKKETRFIDSRECENPFDVEQEVKSWFNSKFKLVAGKKYFEGNETDIKREFNDVISKIILEDEVCVLCSDSGISYWSDGVYGNCLECCCIDCGKNCTCTICDKCDTRINAEYNHQCKLCTRCNTFREYECNTSQEHECICNKCIICGIYSYLRTNKHCDKCYDNKLAV